MSKIEHFLNQCIVLDTETTGEDSKTAEIIESGFVVRKNGNWEVFQDLHKPVKTEIPPKIESICYITNEMVENCAPFSASASNFQNIVNQYKNGYVVAHNYSYDKDVLENNGIVLPKKSICTWRIATKLFMDVDEVAETNLPYLRFALKLDIPIEMRCHRAGYDSLITGHLLETMIYLLIEYGMLDQNADIGEQLCELSNSPIIYKRMPFGKHKGQLMTEVPTSYWNWAMKNTSWFDESADDFNADLAASIHAALEDQ